MTPDPPALPGADRGGALEGVVVVELAQSPAGELAGGLLADLGAVVIKVEPREGSSLRRRGPAIAGEDSLAFQSENRGKYSVVAELHELTREAWLAKLLASADALVEDLGPGLLESAGLSPDALLARNARLALLRISPFGQTGPLAAERGDDRIAQAFSGMQFATGFPDRPPIPVTVPLAEAWSAILGTGALLMAIFHARRSGHGQVVDIGLYQTALRMQEDVVIRHHKTGAVASRMGTESATVVPANVYPTRDGGFIALSGAGDQPFARLCEAIGAPDAVKDPRFVTSAARLSNRAAADQLVRAWVVQHDLADVEARFTKAGVAGTAVRSVDEILGDAHVRARRSTLPLKSSSGRDFLGPAPTPRFSRTPVADAVSAPRLGEHTAIVRASVERIAARPRPSVAPPDARPAGAEGGTGALGGVRVLDLSQWLAGPAAAALLGDFGAEVIMVELPATGPASIDGPGSRGVGFPVTNRNKRSITLDVRSPRGREVFLELVRLSDVIVENFRPGTLERWNLGPEELNAVNPRLVLLRSSGFGQTGPYTARAAFNPVGLAFGGMTYLNGFPDRPPCRDGVTAGDYSTALFNVVGTVAALLRRDVDGQGQVVDTAMYECALRLTGDLLAVRSALGLRRERAAGDSPLYPASLTVEAIDGRFVAVSSPGWGDFADALGRLGRLRADDPARVKEEVGKLAGALAANEAVRVLRQAGLPASVVNSVADLVREPHLWSRGDLVKRSDPEAGEIVMQGIVPILSMTPGRLTDWSRRPGSDNEAVLGGLLGYPSERIREVTSASGSTSAPGS
jgi:crotonobetainyl-CoA:carnitine CoA-transferase CaiB-like acyl-CoA transferase